MKAIPDLSFLLVTQTHLDDLMALSVAPDEAHLVAPVAPWLAEAAYIPDAISFGIFRDEQAVGVISLIDPRLIDDDDDITQFQDGCLYVWRVMIDHQHRKKGYGVAALAFAENYARLIGLKGVSLTTMDKAPQNALPFYKAMGYKPTGRRLDDEIELLKRL